MERYPIPRNFRQLMEEGCLESSDVVNTRDGFYFAYKSLSELLAQKGILDFPDSEGRKLACSNFFDDWFVYAVPDGNDYTYSLLKFREQEHDMDKETPADGDTPGVTISFISFDFQILLECLRNVSEENRRKINKEINRVVAYRGQRHQEALKRYFMNPESEGAYLTAVLYTKHIASFAKNSCLPVPEQYRAIVLKSGFSKSMTKDARLPQFVSSVNESAGRMICDNEKIYIKDCKHPDKYESAVILATHTGNTSLHSFAAEVEYHARFLTPLAKIKIPFLGRSLYDSAIRADMSVGDTEFEGPAPFYRSNSGIVKRQFALHHQKEYGIGTEAFGKTSERRNT